MGFGINKFIKSISFKAFYQKWKRQKIYSKNKGKNLKLNLGCSIMNVKFGNHIYIGRDVSLINIEIGDHSYVNSSSQIRNANIGKFCSIASNVKIVLGWHPVDLITTHPAFYSNNKSFTTFSKKNYFKEYKSVIIGNDVWIGEEVMIPGGVKIGDGAIIAARSVVTKDIPPYTMVGGIPAKIIKYRFNSDEITILLDFKWWDKDEEWFRKYYHKFLNKDIFFNWIKKNEK